MTTTIIILLLVGNVILLKYVHDLKNHFDERLNDQYYFMLKIAYKVDDNTERLTKRPVGRPKGSKNKKPKSDELERRN